MTFSIVAKCHSTGQFGVAAATAMPAVGKLLTHARAGIGAVATQARLNPYIGIDGLRLLQEGLSASDARDRLAEMDPRSDLRQFAVIDATGATASWTGDGCDGWAGAMEEEGFSVQGNILTGRDVLEKVRDTFGRLRSEPLAVRFIEAIEAGAAAGGDSRGERSATIYIVDTEEYPLWDIRVDDHHDPVAELRRLHDVFGEKLVPQIRRMPTRENPAGEHGEDSA